MFNWLITGQRADAASVVQHVTHRGRRLQSWAPVQLLLIDMLTSDQILKTRDTRTLPVHAGKSDISFLPAKSQGHWSRNMWKFSCSVCGTGERSAMNVLLHTDTNTFMNLLAFSFHFSFRLSCLDFIPRSFPGENKQTLRLWDNNVNVHWDVHHVGNPLSSACCLLALVWSPPAACLKSACLALIKAWWRLLSIRQRTLRRAGPSESEGRRRKARHRSKSTKTSESWADRENLRWKEKNLKYSCDIFLKASTNSTHTLMDVNTHTHTRFLFHDWCSTLHLSINGRIPARLASASGFPLTSGATKRADFQFYSIYQCLLLRISSETDTWAFYFPQL